MNRKPNKLFFYLLSDYAGVLEEELFLLKGSLYIFLGMRFGSKVFFTGRVFFGFLGDLGCILVMLTVVCFSF